MGWVQTSSPTSPMTGWPCSFQASTAQPSRRHCISPGTSGSSRLPPMKAPAKSVPPDMLHHQMSGVPMLPRTARVPQRCTSSLKRRAGGAERAHARQVAAAATASSPAFMQLAKNAAPAPKKVTPVSRREAPQHAPVGLVLACRPGCRRRCSRWCRSAGPPSARSTSPSRSSCTSGSARPRCWRRSCSRRRCAAPLSASATMTVPPWPCTMGLGRPVVPLE